MLHCSVTRSKFSRGMDPGSETESAVIGAATASYINGNKKVFVKILINKTKYFKLRLTYKVTQSAERTLRET